MGRGVIRLEELVTKMQAKTYRKTLIVTVLLLLAAIATAAPSASAAKLSDTVWLNEVQSDSCTAKPSCSFDCVPGLVIYVKLTSGDGTITGTCYGTTAECSGSGCDGHETHIGSGIDGTCQASQGSEGVCWVGKKLPEVRSYL